MNRLSLWFGVWALLVCTSSVAAPLKTVSVPLAENVPLGGRIDNLRFLGMLAISNVILDNGIRVGQLSDIVWDETTQVLYAINDKGALFHLRPTFRGDLLFGVELERAVPLREPGNGQPLRQRRADTEGLDLVRSADGTPELIVSFERFPRIVKYTTDGHAIGSHELPASLAAVKNYRNDNSMLESVCVDPNLGVLTAPEQPLRDVPRNESGIYDMHGHAWRYPIGQDDNIVALSCLGNGDVIVLERDLGAFLWNFKIGIKKVHLPSNPTGEPLRVETLATLDTRRGFQIDNFEGIAHHRGNRFFLVSDDNDLFLQRTLLLYFEILNN